MGYENPPIPWSELERKLSGRPRPDNPAIERDDGPVSRKREPYISSDPPRRPADPVTPYAELHCHSNYSFLDGASSPEALARRATELGLHALALTDHDGFYGIVQMAEVAEEFGLTTVFGAELSVGLTQPQNGVADPEGQHLLVLARREEGYHRLSKAITEAQLLGDEKGRPEYDLEQLAELGGEHWTVLTGCRKGMVRSALAAAGADAAEQQLRRLVDLFGRDRVVVELFDHGHPLDTDHNDALAVLAQRNGLPVVATNNVHYASPSEHRLASTVAAVRARRSLDDMDGWLPAAGFASLRTGKEMAARFARYPGAVARSVEIADAHAFSLRSAKPRLPQPDLPEGRTPMDQLRMLVWEGAAKRYPELDDQARTRIEDELKVIADLGFPGYFLIVHEIVSYAKGEKILCQGRGSAANSVVCYALEITAVDPIRHNLPFARFLSSSREEEPDIDVDFDSDRREEVIQHVYEKYGRSNAAQVANVISYRPKSAVRDVAKALGYSTGQQDAWSKQIDAWGHIGSGEDHDIPEPVVDLAEKLLQAPRHLGIHSGGMVLTDRPVSEVVPIERARMDNRTVLQWDKDDCAWMGLVKFDLLGLGMLGALQHTMDIVAERLGEEWELASIPQEEPAVYDVLCQADSVGVFQVESRAQIGTLPRLKPRELYDLVIEVALIRPGPIQGGAVHPYIRRRTGAEIITYPHPKLESVLERTLGVPLFQEQLMQMAMAIGDCTGDDADLLRRAMGSKRGVERIERLQDKLYTGMARNGITGEEADAIYEKIQAFANFGFAESHAHSFALLVYASTWLRLHYPGAFLAALLRSQPMGFYSPQTLVADARRHGVEVLRPDIACSGVDADLELSGDSASPSGRDDCLLREQPSIGDFDAAGPDALITSARHRRDAAFAVRLGLTEVTSIGRDLAERIVADRTDGGPFADMPDLARRIGLTAAQLEALATAGALDCFGLSRRQALWQAGLAAQESPRTLPGTIAVSEPPTLPGITSPEQTMADLWATGISPQSHPIQHVREQLAAGGVVSVAEVGSVEAGKRIRVGGVVTHRQRPATAAGVTFLNLEDETGLLNVICSQGLWSRYRRVARESSALVIRGTVERNEGVTNLYADQLERLPITARVKSRDFH